MVSKSTRSAKNKQTSLLCASGIEPSELGDGANANLSDRETETGIEASGPAGDGSGITTATRFTTATKVRRPKKKTSKVWMFFTEIFVEEKVEDMVIKKPMAACNYCDDVLCAQSKQGTTRLWNHYYAKHEHDEEKQGTPSMRKLRGADSLNTWKYDEETSIRKYYLAIIMHEYPFNFCEHEYTNDFIKSLCPKFPIMWRKTARTRIMEKFHHEKKFFDYFASLNCRFSCTMDLWTSNQNKGYLCVTCHFIDDDRKIQKRIDFHILLCSLSFRNVHMVDLSKCPNVHFGVAIDWLKLAFPELRISRASYCLSFQFDDLLYLLLRCPWIDEIDLTVDTSTVIPKHSVISSSSEVLCKVKPNLRRYFIQYPSYDNELNSVFSNISRLALEGRNDISDVDLMKIYVLKNSLCYINIRNCTLLTDDGISTLLLKCTRIHSMVLSCTSFGNQSIQTLCTSNPSESTDHNDEHANVMAFNVQELHLDGCKGIGCAALSQMMSNLNITKFLCLRETSLTDGALCKFVGSCLEYLDISETMVSMVSLAPVIRRNSNLKCLKTAGCRSLLFEHDEVEPMRGNKHGDFLQEITSTCCLEDVEVGWGFRPIRIEDLIPSFGKVRKMTVGLGTTLADNILHALPEICPFLESLVLRFQVISDKLVRNLLESAINLQVLCLHYCLGRLTSFSFQTKALALRVLRLEWVTPWITNDDLAILTQNCNLVELSLSGCKHLDSSSQEIITSGWPNLTFLHLEECGQITLDGVSSILNCKALENVLLRHTGRGIGRTIIYDAIRELPLLRKLALDLCDASEEGYDTPNNQEGKMMRTVRLSRCKAWRSCLGLPREGSPKPVHKDTIVLEWSSRRLTTTIVKERV